MIRSISLSLSTRMPTFVGRSRRERADSGFSGYGFQPIRQQASATTSDEMTKPGHNPLLISQQKQDPGREKAVNVIKSL